MRTLCVVEECEYVCKYMHRYKPIARCTCSCLNLQPIAFGVAFLQSQISIDILVLYVSFATIR